MTQLADEQLLERFRHWLESTRDAAAGLAAQDLAPLDGAMEKVGLYRLVEEFTALRHETKLQTRSARGLEEQIDKLLAALRESLETIRSIEPKEAEAAWSAGKGLALALTELDESLDRAVGQLEKIVERVARDSEETLLEQLDRHYLRRSWLARLCSRGYHRRVRDMLIQSRAASQRPQLLAAMIEGFRLVQQRSARLLAAEDIVRIATLGEPVDPDTMVVLETIDAPEYAGMVVEEVRRGYTWNGRLLRCAEVRAGRIDAL